MPRPDPAALDRLLARVSAHATAYLRGLDDRPVRATTAPSAVALGGPLPDAGEDAVDVVDALARNALKTMVASTSARYFGFVTGGALPAAMAADMLAPVWDQNAGLRVSAPVAAAAEDTARAWLVDLLGLPPDASVGFVTGGQMANTTALAVARHHVLAAAGWDVERDGLAGAPPITVVVGAERHSTIDRAMRFVGLGSRPTTVAVDAAGALRPDDLARVLDGVTGPLIVCAQVGNVNTGTLDPIGAICDVAHPHGAWVHVDGAFGLWAAVLPRLRGATADLGRADSWAVDAHKWLNVPYDSGMVFTAHPDSHRAATGTDRAATTYLEFGAERDPLEYTPEFSRRARGVAVWAALRSLGRSGVVTLIDHACQMASRLAAGLAAEPGIAVRNATQRARQVDDVVEPAAADSASDADDGAHPMPQSDDVEQPGAPDDGAHAGRPPPPTVVLNQVLVAFDGVDVDRVVAAVQDEGTCWMSTTTWRGERLMRISVSNWQTDTDDVDRSVRAIADCYRALRG